jgi:hypothetical protein
MWDVLAIAPTDDPKAIRRAYAARLRQIDPDRDRAGFARLRQALEWALAGAKQPPRRLPHEEPAREPAPAAAEAPMAAIEIAPVLQARQDVPTFPATQLPAPPVLPRTHAPPPPDIVGEHANERALLIGLESALQRRDARDASQLYCRAAATGALPFGDTERMLARLFTVALEDPTFDGEAFRGLATCFGWDRSELDSVAVSAVRQRVAARLAAEDWYDGLVTTADRKTWRIPRYQTKVARLMLKRIRGFGLFRITRPALQVRLDEYTRHELWVRDRIDPAWVTTLKRRMRRRELVANAILPLFLAALLFDAVIVLVGGIIGLFEHDESSLGILLLIPVCAVLAWLIKLLLQHFVDVWRTKL